MIEAKMHSILRFIRTLQIIGVISTLVGTTFLLKLGIDYFNSLLSNTVWFWGIIHFITILGSSFMILNGLFLLALVWLLRWLLDIKQRTEIAAARG